MENGCREVSGRQDGEDDADRRGLPRTARGGGVRPQSRRRVRRVRPQYPIDDARTEEALRLVREHRTTDSTTWSPSNPSKDEITETIDHYQPFAEELGLLLGLASGDRHRLDTQRINIEILEVLEDDVVRERLQALLGEFQTAEWLSVEDEEYADLVSSGQRAEDGFSVSTAIRLAHNPRDAVTLVEFLDATLRARLRRASL